MNKVLFARSAADSTGVGQKPKGMPKSERAKVEGARLPRWMKTKATFGPNFKRVKDILGTHGLHSVCQEAACPNIRECWQEGTATFMILGKYCTRDCGFCDVLHGRPGEVDEDEPARLAEVVSKLSLKQVVITAVTRDDLPDGGASIFARTIELLRRQDKNVKIELLVSDFGGNTESLLTVLDARPDVLGHNVETVERLHRRVRPAADFERSLSMLKFCSDYSIRPVVKTGLMVGLGETFDEVVETLHKIHKVGCDIVTIGQYLRPSQYHLPVEKYYFPEEFDKLAQIGKEIGLAHVEAGPLVRSSYKAFQQSQKLLEKS